MVNQPPTHFLTYNPKLVTSSNGNTGHLSIVSPLKLPLIVIIVWLMRLAKTSGLFRIKMMLVINERNFNCSRDGQLYFTDMNESSCLLMFIHASISRTVTRGINPPSQVTRLGWWTMYNI